MWSASRHIHDECNEVLERFLGSIWINDDINYIVCAESDCGMDVVFCIPHLVEDLDHAVALHLGGNTTRELLP